MKYQRATPKTVHALERMSPAERRRFLKWMGTVVAAPGVDAAFRLACAEVGAGKAFAAEGDADAIAAGPTYFFEINMRDQVDWAHVFIPPGLVAPSRIERGTSGRKAALFFTEAEVKKYPNDVYLTGDSASLAPHLDSIAMCDTFELTVGNTHGHEAGNPMRSPGKTRTRMPGLMSMFERDGQSPGEGNEPFYSSTPTPATLHNYVQKATTPSVRNGVALKMLGRGKHTVYHFGAGLPGAELDRVRSKAELYSAFPDGSSGMAVDLNILPTQAEAAALRGVLDKVDGRFLKERRYLDPAQAGHAANLRSVEKLLWGEAPKPIKLALTPEEVAFWSEGVPKQQGERTISEIWEQVALLFKIAAAGITRSLALEFDFLDVHGSRTENMLRVMAKQAAMPLGRLIGKLKEAGIYDRSVIAIYTLDGGRPPEAGESGDRGKNSVILAGGGIKGGYYGDVRLAAPAPTQRFSYHAPDLDTGMPGPGVTDNSKRIPGAYIWRTVMKAAGIPDRLAARFPSTKDAKPLSFMLRG
jgi:hypothetical protein